MPRFITGDDLGNIKSIWFPPTFTKGGPAIEPQTLLDGPASNLTSVHALSLSPRSDATTIIAAARSGGSVSLSTLASSSDAEVQAEALNTHVHWSEPRFKAGSRFVGLALTPKTLFTCTSNGILRSTPYDPDNLSGATSASCLAASQTASLPMRLTSWRLAPNGGTHFAYGGDEVELSLWDTERALAPDPAPAGSSRPESKKRKRPKADLLPAETWRARNVSNDALSLRQPVHITSFEFLAPLASPDTSAATHALLAGTFDGHVRRYDTRAARRPVADWRGVAKVGGIRLVKRGQAEHEAFVADQGNNLFALDTRVGRVCYAYKGVAGAVVDAASTSGGFLASVAQDRLFRLHSTHPPPDDAGQPQEEKGEVLDKIFMRSMPTCVVWDEWSQDAGGTAAQGHEQGEGEDDDDDLMWERMGHAEDEDGDRAKTKRK